MSSHWSAINGIALVLSYEEMDEIVENYCRKYPDSKLAEKKQKEKENFILFEDDVFELANGIMFSMTDVDPDYADDMSFTPYKCPDGTLNTFSRYKTGGFISYDWRETGIYALFSDYSINSAEDFLNPPYPPYEHLVQEFKGKLQELVPDNFTWDAHIGRLSYVKFS